MRTLAIVLVGLLLTPLFLRCGIMLNYLLQYQYYVEVLCENRDKPELECNGRCALMTELNQLESPDDQSTPSFPEFKLKESPAELFDNYTPVWTIVSGCHFKGDDRPNFTEPYLPTEEEPPAKA